MKLMNQNLFELLNYIRFSYSKFITDYHRSHEKDTNDYIQNEISKTTGNEFIQEPYLTAIPQYKTGKTIDELGKDIGVFNFKHKIVDNIKRKFSYPLYEHQEQAIRKVLAGKNVVVSTGTGSGKTESFLFPILNDILRDESTGCALILFPMNALVNDQYERLDSDFFADVSEKEKRYWFSKFNGDLSSIEKDNVRKNPPRILVTNYSMLEYMLLRPKDNKFFEYWAKNPLKYIVIDEAHVYRGTTGAEVAMLLRRLKHRLGYEEGLLKCIATSATLGDGSDKSKLEAVQFAQNLFGEVFEVDSIVGPVTSLIHKNSKGDLKNYLADELLSNDLGVVSLAVRNIYPKLSSDATEVSRLLYDAFKNDEYFLNIKEQLMQGTTVNDLVGFVKQSYGCDDVEAQKVVNNLILVGNKARETKNALPLISTRLHVFLTGMNGLYKCSNHNCNKIFATGTDICDVCFAVVNEIGFCRKCFHEYPVEYNKLTREIIVLDSIENNCEHCGANFKINMRRYITGNNISSLSLINTINDYYLISDKERKSPPKQLIFSDNRQDSAYIAAYLDDSMFLDNIRKTIASIPLEGDEDFDDVLEALISGMRKGYAKHCIEDEEGRLVWPIPTSENEYIKFKTFWNRKIEDIKQYFIRDVFSSFNYESIESKGLLYLSIYKLEAEGFADKLESFREQFCFETTVEAIAFLKIVIDIIRKQLNVIGGLTHIRIEKTHGVHHKGFIDKEALKAMEQKYKGYYLSWEPISTHALKNYLERFGLWDKADVLYEFLIENNILKSGKTSSSSVTDFRLMASSFAFQRKEPGDKEWHVCDTCGRLQYRHNGINEGKFSLCVYNKCIGHVCPANIATTREEYLESPVMPVNIEEHTAQVNKQKLIQIQRLFKDNKVHVLSSSTTMELGIDIGSLSSVILRNVPPGAINYAQRVGRAGRRNDAVALAITYCRNTTNDQYFFRFPKAIIAGAVVVPEIYLQNKFIIERHINAYIIKGFYETPDMKEKLATEVLDSNLFSEMGKIGFLYEKNLFDSLLNYIDSDAKDLDVSWWKNIYEGSLDYVCSKLKYLLIRSKQVYDNEINGYNVKIIECNNRLISTSSTNEQDKALKEKKQNERYIRLVEGQDVVSFMCKEGVMPSYAFPLQISRLRVPADIRDDVNLERDLKVALREYTPGNEIVVNKTILGSAGIYKPIYSEEFPSKEYRFCVDCGSIHDSSSGMNCNCGGSLVPQRFILMDDVKDFSVDFTKERQLAGRNSRPNKVYSNCNTFMMDSSSPDDSVDYSSFFSLNYYNLGEFIVANRGHNNAGYYVCSLCGRADGNLGKGKKTFKHDHLITGRECEGSYLKAGFSHTYKSNALTVCLGDPVIRKDFYITFKNALLVGAARAIQVDERELDTVFNINKKSITLLDNAPGGSGYVKKVMNSFLRVLEVTKEIIETCSCKKGCIKCILTSRNQYDEDNIDKALVLPYIDKMIAACNNQKGKFHESLIRNAVGKELLLHLSSLKQQQSITINIVTKEYTEEIDNVITELLQGGHRIFVFVKEGGFSKDTSFVVADKIGRGVEFFSSKKVDENIIIAADYAIKFDDKKVYYSWDSDLVAPMVLALEVVVRSSLKMNVTDIFPEKTTIVNGETGSKVSKFLESIQKQISLKDIVYVEYNDRYILQYARYKALITFLGYLNAFNSLEKLRIISSLQEDIRLGLKQEDLFIHRVEFDRLIHLQKSSIDFVFENTRPDHQRSMTLLSSDGKRSKIILDSGFDFIDRLDQDKIFKNTYAVVVNL